MPLVTRFYGACQDRAHIYLVMELCPGGDLLELLLREGQVLSLTPSLKPVEIPRTLNTFLSPLIWTRSPIIALIAEP